ncbi:melanoregulin-like [Arapaima gigas]
MGLSLCCCGHCGHQEGDDGRREEQQAVLRPCGRRHRESFCDAGGGEAGRWSPRAASSPDGELHAFIALRSQVDENTEEWEKLNYDIHTLKCAGRKVTSRWKKILWQMGYQKEVDSLLAINRQSILIPSEDPSRAAELLCELWRESSLFPEGYHTPDKYLLVMDRLLSLDSAEEFVELAKKKYPKN